MNRYSHVSGPITFELHIKTHKIGILVGEERLYGPLKEGRPKICQNIMAYHNLICHLLIRFIITANNNRFKFNTKTCKFKNVYHHVKNQLSKTSPKMGPLQLHDFSSDFLNCACHITLQPRLSVVFVCIPPVNNDFVHETQVFMFRQSSRLRWAPGPVIGD